MAINPELLNLAFAAAGGILVHLYHRQHAAPAQPAAPKAVPAPAPAVLPALLPAPAAVPAASVPLTPLQQYLQELQADIARSQAHGLLQDLALLAKAKQAAAPGQVLPVPAGLQLPK